MKHLRLRAGLLAVLWAVSVAPGRAQEAADCGMLCHLQGYLATDHMVEPSGEPAAAAPPKAHRSRAPAAHKPAAAAARDAAVPAAVAARKPAPSAEAPKREAKVPTAPPPARVARPSPPPAVAVAASPAPPVKPAPMPTPSRRIASAEARRRTARAMPPHGATRTASLSTAIPGSAPAVEAGFH